MKRGVTIFSMMFFLVGMCGFANAYTIGYDYASDGNGGYTTNVNGAIVETFDNANLLWSWSGDYNVVSGSSSHYSAPYGVSDKETTKYVTVPYNTSNGAATVTKLNGTYNYFGLWWGSVDSYNTLDFFNNGQMVATINGSDIANPANGAQFNNLTNLYVNLYDLPGFDSFEMKSTQYAFEADNIAVGVSPTPEPSTLLLLGIGLVGLALYSRKRLQA